MKDATDVVFGTGPENADKLYDMRSGTLLTFFLLFLSGWIPFVGQAVAGFIGGRKAGSPYRGLIATGTATIAVVLILTVVWAIVTGSNSELLTDPDGQIAMIKKTSPIAAAALEYLQMMLGGDHFNLNYGVYLITVVFGLIGGIVSDQIRKEISIISRNGGWIPGKHTRRNMHRLGEETGEEPELYAQHASHERAERKKPSAMHADGDDGEEPAETSSARREKEKSGREDRKMQDDSSRYL